MLWVKWWVWRHGANGGLDGVGYVVALDGVDQVVVA